MLSSIRCVFRVQHVSNRYDDFSGIKLFPTNENRNGVLVEGHKRFWEATPAGSIELHIPNNSRAIGIFSPGGYVFVDFSEAEPESPPVGIRSEWNLKQVQCSVGSFEVSLHPAAADWDRRFLIDFAEDPDPGSHEEKGSLRRS